MRTSRPVTEKLGTVRQDPDLHGLLFLLINRATGGLQERAAQLEKREALALQRSRAEQLSLDDFGEFGTE